MANQNNTMVRNIIDCVLVILVIFFGYHYFAAPQNNTIAKPAQEQDLFEQTDTKKEIPDKKKDEIPKEMLDLMTH